MSSIFPLHTCVCPVTSFPLNLASGGFSHIFAAISSRAISTFDLFAAAKEKKKSGILCSVSVCSAPSLNNCTFLPAVKHCKPVCGVCICLCDEIKTEQTLFLLLPLFCFHACVTLPVTLCVSSTSSAFTSGGGCAIMSRDHCWPRPFSFWSWRSAVFCYCTLTHLSFIGFLCVSKCVLFTGAVVHIWPLSMSVRGWTWKRSQRLADRTIMASFGCNCLTNVGGGEG